MPWLAPEKYGRQQMADPGTPNNIGRLSQKHNSPRWFGYEAPQTYKRSWLRNLFGLRQ